MEKHYSFRMALTLRLLSKSINQGVKQAMKSKQLALLVVMLLITSGVWAETNTYIGNNNGSWNAASNWSLGIIPTATHDVVITNSNDRTNDRTVVINANAVCNSLTLNQGERSITLNVNGYSLTVTNGITMNAPTGGTRNTTLNIGSGTVNCQTISSNNSGNNNRDNKISISTGTLNVIGSIAMDNSANRNDITFSGAGTINVAGNLTTGTLTGNAGTINIGGETFNPATFTQNSSTVNYNGTTDTQSVGAYTYNNLAFSGNAVKELQGNITVSNNLTLNGGVLRLSNYSLTMSASNPSGKLSGIFNSNSMIETNGTGYLVVNNLTNVADRQNYLFPIGSDGKYAPFRMVNTNSNQTTNISVRTVSQFIYPNFVGRYWDVLSSRSVNATMEFTYDASEANGTPSTYATYSKSGTNNWSLSNGTTTLGTNSFTFAGSVNNIGTTVQSFTAGSAGTFYSYQSGDWNNPTTWTSDASGTTQVGNSVPGLDDVVVILSERDVTLSSNISALNLDVTINDGGVLNIGSYGFASDLKALRGEGRLKISTASFPSATTNTFVQPGGGTVEYTAARTLPSQDTYHHLDLSASGVLLQTSNIAVSGNLTVNSGTFQINDATIRRLQLSVDGDFTVKTGASVSVGTGNTTSGGIMNGGTAPFTNYYNSNSHRIVLNGNFTNNGTVRFTNQAYPTYTSYPTNGFATVYFMGATDNSVYCNGVTDFHNIVLDKGTDQTFQLAIQSTAYKNFRLFGRNNMGGEGGGANPNLRKALWIRTGSLVLRGLLVIPSLTEGGGDGNSPNSDYYIPANGALILDGPEVVILSTADTYQEINAAYGLTGGNNSTYGVNTGTQARSFSIYGKFQINNGYFSTRESGGFITWDVASGQMVVNGGVVDAKQVRAADGSGGKFSYEQSGGTLLLRGRFQRKPLSYSSVDDLKVFTEATINTSRSSTGINDGRGTFNINVEANVFNMSGGTIRVYDVTGSTRYAFDVFASPNNINVTGGTVEIVSTTGSSTDYDYLIRSNGPLGNLKVSRASGSSSTLLANNYPLTVVKNLEVVSGVLNTQNTDVTVGGNIRLYNGSTYTAGTGTLTVNGDDDQTFRIDLASALDLHNLVIQKGKYYFMEFAGTQKTVNIAGNLTLENGELKDNGNVINVSGNINNTGTHTGTGRIHLRGTALQTIGGSGEFQNITLANTNAASAPVSLSSNIIVNGLLNFANDKQLNIGNYNLRLSETGSFSGISTSRYILSNGAAGDGGVTKVFNSNDNFIFPVGVGGYTPVNFKVNGTPTAYGSVTVVPVSYAHPNVTSPNRSLTYFWRMKSEGFNLGSATVTHSYNYLQSSVVTGTGITENGYVAARFNPAANNWTKGTVDDVDENNNIIGGSFLTNVPFIDGDYTAGDDNPTDPFGTPRIFYSRRTGNWNQTATWSLTSHTVDNAPTAVPSASDIVIIGNNHTVSLTTHNTNANTGVQSCASLQVEAGATLDVGYNPGSNFSIVRSHPNGNGLIRVTTSFTSGSTFEFPNGDFSDFNNNLGTTELYTTNSIAGTTFWLPNGVRTYGNLTISPRGGSNVIFPNHDLTILGNCVVNGTEIGSWFCPTWNGDYPTSPAARISKTITVKGNMDIKGGSFIWYGGSSWTNNGGGTQDLVVEGDVIVSVNSGIRVESSNSGQSIAIGGDLINNGTNVNFTNLPATFFGSKDAKITNTSGTPSTTFSTVTVNKGSSKDTKLTCNIGGTLSTPTNNWLTIKNGTFEYVRNGNLSITTTSSFTIPTTGGLYIDTNSEVRIGNNNSNTADLFLNGKLTIVNGTLYVGPSNFPNNNNDIEYSAGGAAEIELTGGSLIVNGQIRRNPATPSGVLRYSQSGKSKVYIMGRNAVATNAKLEIANSGSYFAMADNSELYIVRGGGVTFGDLYLRPETSSVTGGEIIFTQSPGIGIVDEVQSYTLDATVPLNNLKVSGKTTRTERNATVKLLVSPLELKGNLTLENSRSFFDANSDFNINVTIGGDFDNNGAYYCRKNTTTFSGGVQSIKGNTQTSFYDLVVNPVTSLSVIRNVDVERNATIESGTLILGNYNLYVKGNLANNSTYITGSGSITLNSTTVSQDVSGTGTYGRLTLDNSYGAKLLNDVTLQGNLSLQQGILNIGDHLLTLGVSSGIEGTPDNTKMITTDGVYSNKGVKKLFNANFIGTFNFPVGVANKYTPARFQATANTGGTGYVRVNPVNSQHPSSLSPYRVLNYYWDVESSGMLGITGTLQLTYTDDDVLQSASDEVDYVAARLYVPGTNWGKATSGSANDNVNETTNIITFRYNESDNLSGEYTAGVDSDLPDNIPVYRTVKDGEWNDPTVWEQVGVNDPTLPAIPNGFVVIIDHDIEVTTANILAYRTVINNRLKFIDGFAGHKIGNVEGSGTLYVESQTFPAGVYTDFLDCSSNSVLEYGGIDKDYIISANLYTIASTVKITGTGVRTMPNRHLTFCNKLIFDGPDILMQYGATYTIQGTLERYGTTSITATSGTINFAGSAAQTIGGSTGDFYGATALGRIQINNATGVTLLSPTEATIGLTLTNGLLHTSDDNALLISASITNAVNPVAGRTTSYVNGPLVKRIDPGSSFQYPIGKDDVFNNKLTLSNSLPGTIDWKAEFFTPNATYTEKMGDVSAVDAHGFFRVSSSAGASATVNLDWDSNSDVTPLVTSGGLADMRVVRYDVTEGKWDEISSNATGNNNKGTVSTASNVTSPASGYADYAVGSVNSIKPKLQFNTVGTSVCGLTSGLPLSIVATGVVAFPYTVVYSINNVKQPEITITSMPYTIATPVAGDYKLVSFTYNNGKRSGVVDNKTVAVLEIPTVAVAGTDQSICGASSATMSANTAIIGTGVWSVVSGTGGSFETPTSPSSVFNGTNGTDYVLRWTISNGACISADDMEVSFPLLPVRPGDFVVGSPVVCQGVTDVVYSVPDIPAAVYHWDYSDPDDVTIVENQGTVRLSFGYSAKSGVLSVYTSNGCGDSATRDYVITVNETVPVTLSTADDVNNVCFNQTLTFTADKVSATAVNYQFFVDGISVQAASSSNTSSVVGLTNDNRVHVESITADGCRHASNEIVITTGNNSGLWTGSNGNNWFDVANWCDGSVPVSSTSVIVNNTTNAPEVSGTTLAVTGNLTITNNTLTVKPGAKMTVNGNIDIIGTGALVIENNLNGLEDKTGSDIEPASFINHGNINASVTIRTNFPALPRNWYLGMPVAGNSSAYYSKIVSGKSFSLWTYNHANNKEEWPVVPSGATLQNDMTTYVIKNGTGAEQRVDVVGTLVNSTQTMAMSVAAKNGFNLVANPFTAYLDPTKLNLGITENGMEPTIWYRTVNAQRSYTFETFNTKEGITLPIGSSDLIAPMQGFWVRARETGKVLEVRKDMLQHPDGGNNPQLKSAKLPANDVLYLELSNSKTSDQLAIAMRASGNDSYSNNDSEKRLSAGSVPDFYSVKSGKYVAINIVPDAPATTTVNLGCNLANGANSNLKISALNLSSFMPGTEVFLEDRLTGDVVNLRNNGEYSFESATGAINSRFVLTFSRVSTDIDDSVTAGKPTIRIYGNDGKAIVNIDSELIVNGANIRVFTLSGALVSIQKVSDTRSEISLPDASAIYVIEAEAGGVVKREKIVK